MTSQIDFTSNIALRLCYEKQLEFATSSASRKYLDVTARVLVMASDMDPEDGWFGKLSKRASEALCPDGRARWEAGWHTLNAARRALYLVALSSGWSVSSLGRDLDRHHSSVQFGARAAGQTLGWRGRHNDDLVEFCHGVGIHAPIEKLVTDEFPAILPQKKPYKPQVVCRASEVQKRRARLRAILVETGGYTTLGKVAREFGLSESGLRAFLNSHATDLNEEFRWGRVATTEADLKRVTTLSALDPNSDEVRLNIRKSKELIFVNPDSILPSDKIEAMRTNEFQVINVNGVRRGLKPHMSKCLPPGFGDSFSKKQEKRYGR